MPHDTDDLQLLNSHAIAELTGLDLRAVQHLLYVRRAWPVVRLGRLVYVRRSDLVRWIDANTQPASETV